MPRILLADIVLALHAAIVLFIVAGLPLIVIGKLAGWAWVNRWRFRLLHLAAIAIVVAQAWLGLDCPLTVLEWQLRGAGAPDGHADGFIAHWLARFLYHRFPTWVFTLAYTVFGLAVALAWWHYPPKRGRRSIQGK